MGNLVFFTLIYNYLKHEINSDGLVLMQRMMVWASTIALVLVTLWVLIEGYRIVTGRSRAPMMGLVINMTRIALVVTVATTMSVFGTDLHDLFTNQLSAAANQLVTGENASATDAIDENLAWTQAALIAIDSAAQSPPGDVGTALARSRALTFATLGTASPPMAAAAMLLLYQFALALFIGLGPLFILCLIFDQTRELFRKWLLYGIGTLFSMAVLSLVSAIVLKLTLSVAEAMWASSFIEALARDNSAGITTQAMEQGGVGLLMTALIVSTPPMAAMFFNGTMGNFLYFSAFGRGGEPGPHGEPPGAYQYRSTPQPVSYHGPSQPLAPAVNPSHDLRGTLPSLAPGADVVRRYT